MSNLVIVAIPAEDDQVWDISSEKVPHMTLLFLGENGEARNADRIFDFVSHAAQGLSRFSLDVHHRGTLGADDADVLFFDSGWGFKEIETFRSQLLQNTDISNAYNSVEQFPQWTPHLTLGYPETPAAEIDRNDRRSWVTFDRIALWTGESEGPEFYLSQHDYMEVAMSDVTQDPVADLLKHHGVKGMKWGRRKSESSSSSAPAANPVTTKTVVTPGKKTKIKTTGGENHDAHPDAVRAKVANQKLKKSGTDTLSNKELQELATRMNLELQVSRLNAQQPQSPAAKFINQLKGNTEKQVNDAASQAATKQIAKLLAKGATAGAA